MPVTFKTKQLSTSLASGPSWSGVTSPLRNLAHCHEGQLNLRTRTRPLCKAAQRCQRRIGAFQSERGIDPDAVPVQWIKTALVLGEYVVEL